MKSQTEASNHGFQETDLVFSRTVSKDYETVTAISLAFALAHAYEDESMRADLDYVDKDEYDDAFDEEAKPQRHLQLLPNPMTDLEIIRKAHEENAVEIGESQIVRSLPVERRVQIANTHSTSLVLHEDEAEALTGVIVLAEGLATRRPELSIPKGFFSRALDELDPVRLQQVA